MSDRPFLRFIDLIAIDQKIQSLIQKLAALDKPIDALNKKRSEYASTSDELQKKIVQFKKNVDMQELEMKVLDEREREKKKKLDTLSDYKEYQAIKNEIEAIQRLQVDHEKIVLDAWHQLENAQDLLQKRNRDSSEILQQLDEDINKLVQEKEMFSHELSHVQDQREAKTVGIPEEWLEKYNVMGQRVANPVV